VTCPHPLPRYNRGIPSRRIVLTLCAALLVLPACGKAPTATVRAAPSFDLADLNGGRATLASLKGKVVVLDFWATWCAPCRRGMPGIQKLRDRYAADRVAVLGLSTSESGDADPAAFMQKAGYTYTTLLHGERAAPDYKAEMLPTVYILDQDGKVLHAERGYRAGADEEFAQLIDGALER